MKIAFFTDSYHPDLNGVVISIDEYANMLRKKGHIVYIVAAKVQGYKEKDPYVLRFPSFTLLHSDPNVMIPLPLPPKQLIAILKLDIDIIHAHGNGFFSLLGHEVARMKKIPFVMTFHNLHTEYTHYFFKGRVIKPGMMAAFLRIFANMCDGVLTPSEKMRQSLITFGVNKKITVLPNFVNLANFTEQKKGFLHKKLKLSQDIPLLLSVGRLGKEKNFPFLLNAFKDLTISNNNAHLVIVGGGVDKEKLLNLTKSLGLRERVYFTGKIQIKFMPLVYADASIFVFASTTEVHPLVVLEAVASGLPIVAVEDLAFKDVVINDVNGFMVPLDTQVFSSKMKKILEDINLQKRFRDGSKKIIKEGKESEELTDELISFYNKITQGFSYKKPTRPLVGDEFVKNFRKRINQINKIIGIDEKYFKNIFHDTVVAVKKLRDSF